MNGRYIWQVPGSGVLVERSASRKRINHMAAIAATMMNEQFYKYSYYKVQWCILCNNKAKLIGNVQIKPSGRCPYKSFRNGRSAVTLRSDVFSVFGRQCFDFVKVHSIQPIDSENFQVMFFCCGNEQIGMEMQH